jgi:hypothetical protein
MIELPFIANSGIQFHKFEFAINPESLRSQKFVYYEFVDPLRMKWWLDELFLIREHDVYVLKSELKSLGFLDDQNRLNKDFQFSAINRRYSEDQPQVFDIGNSNQVIKTFEGKWIPLPFFKYNSINKDSFGPTDWVRICINKIEESKLEIVIAIDTTVTNNNAETHTPFLDDNPQENKFRLCSNDDLILNFFHPITNGEWVADYISSFFKFEDGDSKTKYIASYIFLLRILRSTEKIPTIHILSDKSGTIDVDLVLDIGNSRTCALLFENPNDISFNLNKVKQLELIDLSDPFNSYSGSFSTRLVFHEAEFYSKSVEINQFKKFQWASMVRIGQEAEKLINRKDIGAVIQLESKSFNSSPKRYLWDTEMSDVNWCFYNSNFDLPKRVYKSGISEQLKSDGSLCIDGIFGTSSKFSRKSLMTFVYLEIFAHATRQINSIEFRNAHENSPLKRRLKRVIISCPTAMIKTEQIALRECAKEALNIARNYSKIIAGDEPNYEIEMSDIQIIPDITDITRDIQNQDKKKDWIYDEATVAQLMFVYGTVKHKFNGNPDLFFRLFGRKNFDEPTQKNSITIGSIDIGAGTTDLMICNYTYNYNDSTEFIPDPLYWESFTYAGDELLKNVIQKIIIEGDELKELDKGCSGVILNHGRKRNSNNIIRKINGFFGRDNANMGYLSRLMRISFLNQIAIPIATKYMNIANDNNFKDEVLTYNDIFKNEKPSKELLEYFFQHFEFRFEEIEWKISRDKVNSIIEETFAKLLKQLAEILHVFKCDLIILSGRPCSFKALENYFMKLLPVTPNRLVNLNDYWIGKWFPFSDENGYIKDPKTIITVGSLISVAGGKLFRLEGFRFNVNNLKQKLQSTANYLGPIQDFTINKVYMSKEMEISTFEVDDLPYYIGFKNIDSENYPSRYLYCLQFNNRNIKEQMKLNPYVDSNQVNDALENRKTSLREKLPYKLNISRDLSKDKEKIKIESIQDSEGNDLNKNSFELKVITLNQAENYWLDSGEFTLTINK